MALFRSTLRRKHYWIFNQNDPQYFVVPHSKFPHILKPVDYRNRTAPPAHYKLRGSGLHGPENGDVMKLNLWNRLRQKRPQREVPALWVLQKSIAIEHALLYWLIGLLVCVTPMKWWSSRYGAVHDHFPWNPPRLDGTRGEGARMWWCE